MKISSESKALRAKFSIPPMAKAIRLKCLDCSGEGESWVKTCTIKDCALWPYRMGRQPKAADMVVPKLNRHGELAGDEDE